MLTLIYFILILGFIVLIHEGGHFFFAKKAGIYVYEFSIGMGPKIFKWKRKGDETQYSIGIFPIGGYVQMAGESVEDDKSIPKDRTMQAKTWLQRFLTMIAGVMMNFLLAIVLLFVVALLNGAPSKEVYVATVTDDSAASIAGMRTGAQITKFNGKKVNSSDKLMLEIAVNSGKTITLELDGKDSITITPTEDESGNFRYGFGVKNEIHKGFLASLKYAFTKFFALIEQMFMIIWYLITGKLSLNNLSGPVGIYNLVGETAKTGFANVLYLVGYLSLNVGFINLLPLPAFDGGRVLFLVIEKIKGKPVSPKVENTVHAIGFALLMLLMIAITFNDIRRLFF